jgi:hypothetical protein
MKFLVVLRKNSTPMTFFGLTRQCMVEIQTPVDWREQEELRLKKIE